MTETEEPQVDIGKAVEAVNERLEAVDGTLQAFDTFIHNHSTDLRRDFGQLRKTVTDHCASDLIRDNARDKADEARDIALQTRISAFKWGLVLVASFTAVALAGTVALAAVALTIAQRMIG